MARGNWDSLSSGYRNRLERGGISRTDYESGASLSAARGHKSGETKASITADAIRLKIELLGDRSNWNEKTAKNTIMRNPENGRPRTAKEIRKIRTALKKALKARSRQEEWEEEIFYEDLESDRSSFFYH